MKVYLVICGESYGDIWVESIFAKEEDAKLEMDNKNDWDESGSPYRSYHIQEWEVK